MTTAEAALAAGTAAHRSWAGACLTAIDSLAAQGRPFTAEDVRALALLDWHQPGQLDIDGKTPSERPSHNVLPAAIHTAAQQKLIRPIGYRQATRPARRGGVLRIWTGAHPTHRKEPRP